MLLQSQIHMETDGVKERHHYAPPHNCQILKYFPNVIAFFTQSCSENVQVSPLRKEEK